MDLATDDPRAAALAPHLVVVRAAPDAAEWTDPQTGTTCRLDVGGDYVVLRRVGERLLPVVAGAVMGADAALMVREPEALRTRRAVALAVVGVQGARPS